MRRGLLRLPRLPRVLAGWPRKAAAALCFAVALLGALTPGRAASTRADVTVPAGMVRTSASVYADGASFVRRGDRIDLVEPIADAAVQPAPQSAPQPATVVARNVRVLDIRSGGGFAAQNPITQLVVAALPDVAAAIAARQGVRTLAVTSASP